MTRNLLVLTLFLGMASGAMAGIPHLQRDRVAVVRVIGPIFESEGLLVWMRRIERGIPRVKAVVLEVDSPGGGVAASQQIAYAVKRLQARGLKVVVSMGSEAASGGYYVACGADRIVANPGTLTGSLGVILEVATAEKLLNWAGIRFETVKSGRFKDTGSFSRPMTAQDRAVLQNVVDDVYDQFVEAILEGRRQALTAAWTSSQGQGRIKPDDEQLEAYLRGLADGRIYSGREALDLGLVDELGDFQDAVDLACELGGIQGEPELVTLRRKVPFLERLTGINFVSIQSWMKHLNLRGATRLSYLAWGPIIR